MTPSLTQALGLFFQAHPWHGVTPGENAPDIVTCYIEMVPTDAMKYEVDKATGKIAGRQTLMRIDAANGAIEIGNIYRSAIGFMNAIVH